MNHCFRYFIKVLSSLPLGVLRWIALPFAFTITPGLLLEAQPLDSLSSVERLQHQADSLYVLGRYLEAAPIFEQCADRLSMAASVRAQCYLRAGGAYQKAEQLGQALLCYRRALCIAPDYYAALRAADHVRAARIYMSSMEYPLLRHLGDICAYALPLWGWAFVAFVIFVGIVVTVYFFRMGRTRALRRTSFYVMCLGLLLWMATLLILLHRQYYSQKQADQAIVITAHTTLYPQPQASGEPILTLYDGAEITLLDTTLEGWSKVALPNGVEGYLPHADLRALILPTARTTMH